MEKLIAVLLAQFELGADFGNLLSCFFEVIVEIFGYWLFFELK